MSYIYLAIAILCEVIGTILLPVSQNFTKILPTITLSLLYILAFYFLTYSLKSIPIAIVYATWSGLGIFSISILSYFIYGETLQWQSIIGLFFIITGIIIVNIFSINNNY